MIKENLNSF